MNVAVVSSDDCSQDALDQFYEKKKNKDIPTQKAISMSKSIAKSFYKQDINRAVKNLRRGKNLIVLDKNTDSPGAVDRLFRLPP